MESPFNAICQEQYKAVLMKRLEQKRALVISTTVCPACTKAKSLLERNNIDYMEISLDMISEQDSMEVGNCVYGSNPRRFVPYIYLDNKALGGYAELYQLHQTGKLKGETA